MCQKLCKLIDSRQSYCNENRVQFFWPTRYAYGTNRTMVECVCVCGARVRYCITMRQLVAVTQWWSTTRSSFSAGRASTRSSSTPRQPTTPATRPATQPESPSLANNSRSGSRTCTAATSSPTPTRHTSVSSSCQCNTLQNYRNQFSNHCSRCSNRFF